MVSYGLVLVCIYGFLWVGVERVKLWKVCRNILYFGHNQRSHRNKTWFQTRIYMIESLEKVLFSSKSAFFSSKSAFFAFFFLENCRTRTAPATQSQKYRHLVRATVSILYFLACGPEGSLPHAECNHHQYVCMYGHFEHFSFFGHVELPPPTHTHTNAKLTWAGWQPQHGNFQFKLTWSSSLVVPHMQVYQALYRSHGLATILDFLKN